MTKTNEAIATTLEKHSSWRAHSRESWTCACGYPLSADTPAIDHRAHLIAELVQANVHEQVTTTAELDALPDRTIVRSAAGTVANLAGDQAYFFGHESSVPRRMLELPLIILQHAEVTA